MNNSGMIEVLDTTLRDGGLGMEDAYIKGIADLSYSNEESRTVLSSLVGSEVDIIEIGSIQETSDDRTRFCIYQSIDAISKQLIGIKRERCKFAALYRGPDTDLNKIPCRTESHCDLVRVILRYSELDKSLDFCTALSEKGYHVCVQPMLTMRYTPSDLDKVWTASNEMHAYACYFVDSYGYMTSADIRRFFSLYDANLDTNIRIGFHAHNNCGLAFSNVVEFLNIHQSRHVIVDACLYGLGQGAGNMQTEILADYLNKNAGKLYRYDSILDGCECVERFAAPGRCGYTLACLLPALHKAAYKYGIDMRLSRHMTYRQLNSVLKSMPDDMKQRYTSENMERIIKDCKGAGIL